MSGYKILKFSLIFSIFLKFFNKNFSKR